MAMRVEEGNYENNLTSNICRRRWSAEPHPELHGGRARAFAYLMQCIFKYGDFVPVLILFAVFSEMHLELLMCRAVPNAAAFAMVLECGWAIAASAAALAEMLHPLPAEQDQYDADAPTAHTDCLHSPLI